jgi:hypothetical protein
MHSEDIMQNFGMLKQVVYIVTTGLFWVNCHMRFFHHTI